MDKGLESQNILFSTGESIIKNVLLSSFGPLAPIVGMYNDYKNIIQYNNLVDILNSHIEQFNMLKEIVIDKLYVNSYERIRDLHETFAKAKDELNEEKRKLYASYLTSCCHIDYSKSFNKRTFLDIIGRIDTIDIYILKIISESKLFEDSVKSIISSDYFKTKEIKKSDVEIHIDYLMSFRLIEVYTEDTANVIFPKQSYGNIAPNPFNKNVTFYRLTRLAKELLIFISKAE